MEKKLKILIKIVLVLLFTSGCNKSLQEKYYGKNVEIYSIDTKGNLIREKIDYKIKDRMVIVYEFDKEHLKIGEGYYSEYGELYEEFKYNKNGKTIRRIVYHSNGKIKDEYIYNDKEELIKVNSYNRKGEKLY